MNKNKDKGGTPNKRLIIIKSFILLDFKEKKIRNKITLYIKNKYSHPAIVEDKHIIIIKKPVLPTEDQLTNLRREFAFKAPVILKIKFKIKNIKIIVKFIFKNSDKIKKGIIFFKEKNNQPSTQPNLFINLTTQSNMGKPPIFTIKEIKAITLKSFNIEKIKITLINIFITPKYIKAFFLDFFPLFKKTSNK